jgi:hypothetical protein
LTSSKHISNDMRFILLSIVVIIMTICIVTTEGYSLIGTTTTLTSKKIETTRRIFGIHIVSTLSSISILPSFAVTEVNPVSLLINVQESRKQLDTIPKYIDASQWDSVRAQLIRPPLSDCWVKTSSRPWLTNYINAIGTNGGDELAALEAKEELQSHLRYLDMAVYNNNFNPIVSEGTNGASQDLIRSYYEDPIREWKASVQALDELLALGQSLQNNS